MVIARWSRWLIPYGIGMSRLKATIRKYAPKPLLKFASASKNGLLDFADVLLGRSCRHGA
jgi:hypothetical protein